jgi:RNA polymerase sigma-70 factor, ECF subfamily
MNEAAPSGHGRPVRDSFRLPSAFLPFVSAEAGAEDAPRSSARLANSERADDSEVVERLRRRDTVALGEVYDEHHEHVRAFARRLLGDAAAAEDLVQETFLALPSVAKNFRGDASLRTFVLGVAANHARHHVRAAARRRALHARSAEADREPPSTPEERVRRKELAHELVRALDALPFDQRVAIVLCEVEERTATEVARIVGAPEATVRTRVFHARRKLREMLDSQGIR